MTITQKKNAAAEARAGAPGAAPNAAHEAAAQAPARQSVEAVAEAIIGELGSTESAVIAILQAIQEHYRYLPPEVFPYIARRVGIGEARVYSVATFYENFSLEPKGKYILKICDGTACHVRKSIPILDRLRGELALSGRETTTKDLMFTVETVSCLGACGLAPVMTVNDKVYPAMTPDKAAELLAQLKEGE